MSAAISQAAISYFGLPEGTQLVEGGPAGHFAFVIPLTEEHLRGIADRMKALAEPVPYEQTIEAHLSVPTREQLRADWNKLTPKEQGVYGSFGMFCKAEIMASPGIGGREVQHVDAPVDAAPSALPDAVWVSQRDMLAHQVDLASEVQQLGGGARNYLMQVIMLTDEQRIKYAGGA